MQPYSHDIKLPQHRSAAGAMPMGRNSGPLQRKKNNTGLTDQLRSGIEDLSGYSMDDVKVHYNSGKPAQLKAFAFTQGTDIHVGPGQQKYLPHEAWHVVQQKQGRVKPTLQMKGYAVNGDQALEQEADLMGSRAARATPVVNRALDEKNRSRLNVVQCTFVDKNNKEYKDARLKKVQDYITENNRQDLLAEFGRIRNTNNVQEKLTAWVKNNLGVKLTHILRPDTLNKKKKHSEIEPDTSGSKIKKQKKEESKEEQLDSTETAYLKTITNLDTIKSISNEKRKKYISYLLTRSASTGLPDEQSNYIQRLGKLESTGRSKNKDFAIEFIDPGRFDNKAKVKTTKGVDRQEIKPFNYHGTKGSIIGMLSDKLNELTDQQRSTHILEPFTGSAQLLLNSDFDYFKMADYNPDLIDFYKISKYDPANLEIEGRVAKAGLKRHRAGLKFTETDNSENRKNILSTLSENLDNKALTFLFKQNYVKDNKIKDLKSKEFHRNIWPSLDMAELLNRFADSPEVEISYAPADETLKAIPDANVLVYLDPPYVKFNKYNPALKGKSSGEYSNSFSSEQQFKLIQRASEIANGKLESGGMTMPGKGKVVVLSNYAHTALIEKCIEGGAAKIYIFPVRHAQGGYKPEMLAVFTPQGHGKERPVSQVNAPQAADKVPVVKWLQKMVREKPGIYGKIDNERNAVKKTLVLIKKEIVGLRKRQIPHDSIGNIESIIRSLNSSVNDILFELRDEVLGAHPSAEASIVETILNKYQLIWDELKSEVYKRLRYKYEELKRLVKEEQASKKAKKAKKDKSPLDSRYFTPNTDPDKLIFLNKYAYNRYGVHISQAEDLEDEDENFVYDDTGLDKYNIHYTEYDSDDE